MTALRTNPHRLDRASTAVFLLALHLLIWTSLPLVLSRNLPLDVVEALAWGREWQWGYYKHPPLSGWLAELARMGARDWPLFLLAQVMVTGALSATWLLGRDLCGTRWATLSLLATEGVHYFNMSSTEFNANVVMFPFWAWASLSFWRAHRTGLLRWWLGFGLCCGAGTLGKYVFLLLPASLFLYTITVPGARRHWRTSGPWLAALVFVLIVVPHVRWAIACDWPTLHYALDRGHSDEMAQTGRWLSEFISFVLAQALSLLPLGILLRSLGPMKPVIRPPEDRWLLFALGASPLLLMLMAATVEQAKMLHMWASPFFLCVAPLWLAWRQPSEPNIRRFTTVCLAWIALTVIIFSATSLLGTPVKHRLDRGVYPGRDIAAALTRQWHDRTGQPLRIVAGEEFVAGIVSQYSADRPSVFYDADFRESLWLTPEQVRRQGAVFAWPIGRGEVDKTALPADSRAQVGPLLARYPHLQPQRTLVIETTWLGHSYSAAVAWAILPPETVR